MPTIFDKYEIHFDGNNLYCDYPIIIGVNGTNTTKLVFDVEAGIEGFMLNTRTGGALAYEPVNDVVTLNPPPSYVGEDYDCLVMLEAGNYHLQVSIVETPYFHDEDTEGKATTAEADISAVETTTAHLTAEVGTLKNRLETADNDISGLQNSVSNVGAIATKAQNDATQALDDAANAMADAAAARSTANEAKNAIKNLAPSYSLEGPKTQTLDSSYRAVLEGVDLTSSYWLEVVAGATNQLFSALTVIITSNNTLNTRIILDGSIKGDAGNLMFTAAILPMFGVVDIQPIGDKNFASSRAGRPPSDRSRFGNITVIAKGTEVAGATIRLYRIVTNYGG